MPAPLAAKVRGMSNWAGSNSYGRVGRIGLSVLKAIQYGGSPQLSLDQVAGLKLHRQ